MSGSINQLLLMRAEAVETALARYIATKSAHIPALTRLGEAVSHAAMGGGKRLRPFLVTECAHLCGSTVEAALPAACAIEMVHCYSLVHDDLPAMDDSDLRRGQPSVHRAFDEAIAILAGDALLTDAFSVLADAGYPAETCAELVGCLAHAAGSEGMVGGQMMDLYPENVSEDEIVAIQRRKTGALIMAATQMGAIVADATPAQQVALRDYASALGLAFQIVDDVLDVTQTEEQLGKPVGADDDAGKSTFVSLLGLEGARQRIAILTEQADTALEIFGEAGDTMRLLAQGLSARTA